MSIASAQSYVMSLLNQMSWPSQNMAGLPPLNCFITPPDPNVQSESPTAYVWPVRGRESRDTSRLRAGTVPRIAVPGGPSGTKVVEHSLSVWLIFNFQLDDPDADNLLPEMLWAMMDVLRSASFGASQALAANPAKLTDPWTGVQSYLIDIGEDMSYDIFLRTLEGQRLPRYDGVIDLSLTEVIAS